MALSNKQLAFISEYLRDFNGAQAAIRSGYSEKAARQQAARLLTNAYIRDEISRRVSEKSMGADEVLVRLGELARGDMRFFYKVAERWTEEPLPSEEILEEKVEVRTVNGKPEEHTLYLVKKIVLDMDKLIDPRYSYLLQEFTDSPKDGLSIKITNKLPVLQTLAKVHRLDSDEPREQADAGGAYELPASIIAPSFLEAYDDIREHGHTEYVFYGGRGSTKSSFISLAFIWIIKNYPNIHLLALRQVENTLRNSVYAQIQWAINELGLTDQFKCTTSPMEITYLPTGQKIYFRGADEPGKIKSIKTPFGYIGGVWFEELDQFKGEEAIRKIEQSAIRGGDLAFIFKSYNPPPTASAWVNKYVKVPKATRFQHKSTYLDLGSRIKWLGKPFVEEAEHLHEVNPKAYDHEYMGEVTGTGGLVFDNVTIRKISDEEIYGQPDGFGGKEGGFDHILMGNDWGFFPDPWQWVKCHYDAARHILYIFDELRLWKAGNEKTYKALVEEKRIDQAALLISDSAEPKSVADYRAYGQNCRGAEKGPDSVAYSMKWLQSLAAIIIDNERCPYAAEEFLNYELEPDPNEEGSFINEYPDKNNHAIDAVRYATNLIWRRRGQ